MCLMPPARYGFKGLMCKFHRKIMWRASVWLQWRHSHYLENGKIDRINLLLFDMHRAQVMQPKLGDIVVLKNPLHGAIICINTQLKSTKRAISCSSLQFLVSQHVLKFVAQRSNLSQALSASQRCQRHDSIWAERISVAPALTEPIWPRISMQLLIIIYSHTMLINLNLGHSFISRKGGKANRTKKNIGYV